MRPWSNLQPEPRGRLTSWLADEHQRLRRARASRPPRTRVQVSPRGMILRSLLDGSGAGGSGGREPRWA